MTVVLGKRKEPEFCHLSNIINRGFILEGGKSPCVCFFFPIFSRYLTITCLLTVWHGSESQMPHECKRVLLWAHHRSLILLYPQVFGTTSACVCVLQNANSSGPRALSPANTMVTPSGAEVPCPCSVLHDAINSYGEQTDNR